MTEDESALFPPPDAPACLYVGEVMHARLKPFVHRFAYRVFSLLIDLDRLDAAGRLSRVFSVDRGNLVSFRQSDHGPRDGTPLAAHARALMAEAGRDVEGGRVLLLCYPRIFGYAFNPLAVYFVYDRAGVLAGAIYEVRNTFGQMHTYVAPVRQGELDVSGLKQERDKIFYVSPFIDLAMRYLFRIRPPGEDVRLRILEVDRDGPLLSATFAGAREELATGPLMRLCAAIPFLGLKIVAGIHWEALKLWLKGARLVAWPSLPHAVSHDEPGPYSAPAQASAPIPNHTTEKTATPAMRPADASA